MQISGSVENVVYLAILGLYSSRVDSLQSLLSPAVLQPAVSTHLFLDQPL